MNQDKKQKEVKRFIYEEKLQVFSVIETRVKIPKLAKICSRIFGQWEWVSNARCCISGCRIVVGWNPDVVRMMVIQESKQQMLCLIENIKDHSKVFCSFIYASSSSYERRELWKELDTTKNSIRDNPWIQMGDFNAFAIFHPFLVSDHSPTVLVIPNAVSKKKRSFKFANFVAEKEDFLPMVEQSWNEKVNGCNMFRVVKRNKLKDAQNAVNEQPYDNERKRIAAVVLNDYNEAMVDEDKLLFLNGQSVAVERNDVVTEFLKHFEKFLGQSQHVEPLGELEGIFTNTLSHEEALDMVKDVTDKETKNAMFDINDYKAPRPDGYSACFFKKAWAVIGKDVCQAVKDFFENGKLLKEINSTLIALIPKVAQPNNVTEFRPIACCNVIYKCISKILTSRIKNGLNKSVNLNQSAFIHGRSIQDNILLTQELLKGYNRKGGSKRCSLKIDIAKAYDTVSWEFLRNILRIKIQQAQNFKYHAGCKEMKLTHLCFADDLSVLCHGSAESVIVIKEALDLFSKVLGLKPNMNKSTIYFSNVDIGEKCRILNIMPYQVGSFPTRFLGVPLIYKRLGKTKCKQLVDRVKSKVGDWKNKFLSYAGRVQLIAYVLSSMHIYRASVFHLPKSIMKEIERVLKGFLWNQGDVGRSVWEIDVETNDSWIWKHLLNLRSKERRHIEHKIGNGENTSIWFDKWCDSRPLCQIITNSDIYDARFNLKASIADMITNEQWIWNDEWQEKFPNICSINVPILTNEKDRVVWKSKSGSLKKFSVKQVWDDYNEENPNVNWGTLILIVIFSSNVPTLLNWSIKSVLSKTVLGAAVYYIWQERNKRQFTNERRNVDDLSRIILDTVRLKLSSIKVIKTIFVESVEKEWGVKCIIRHFPVDFKILDTLIPIDFGCYLRHDNGNWLNNQMREGLGNVVMELWSGAKWGVCSWLNGVVHIKMDAVAYMAIVGSFPFNSFLSGVLSCVGTAVLAVCLRIQVNKENKEFKDLPPERAFADFVLCNLVLHLVIMNFLG
ncbi:RNA-directed DNA polymerase, eukaryota, reverse transcriptase zinc-binding domain protein [Tanacetum coccineum]